MKTGAELVVGVSILLVVCRACILAIALIASPLLANAEQLVGGDRAAAALDFHIASQPLSDALYAYSAVTGVEVLIPGDVLANRRSPSVSGLLTPDTALNALLAGSGLVPRAAGPNAITLVPGVSNRSTTGRVPRFPQYSAELQAAVTKVLCQLHETQPGGYRVAVRLWVNPAGEVTQVGVLGTTGDVNRDKTLSTLLKHVAIGVAPPSGLVQPTTLVVLPRQEATGCTGGIQGPAR